MQHKIIKIYSVVGASAYFLWFGFLAFFIISQLVLHLGTLASALVFELGVLCGIAVVVGLLVYSIYWQTRLTQHRTALEAYADVHKYQIWRNSWDDSIFNGMSLAALPDANVESMHEIMTGEDWTYGEFSYEIRRHGRYGDYTLATVYYSVMATALPRSLPNVFFDSSKARGSQFRLLFDQKQRHSLEGDFDNFFTTYFPSDYAIDSMSFVTPDVMWALRAAADYDIEIVGNKLLMYGVLYEPAQQLPDMAAKLAAIKARLLENILTYRDERLPYGEGRQKVAPLGAELQRRHVIAWASIVTVVLYLTLRLLLAYFDN